jgi:hypothetical protein
MADQGKEQDMVTARKHPHVSTIVDWMPIEWDNYITCLTETKADHKTILHFYKHAMAIDPD